MDDERQRIVRNLWEHIRGLTPENVGNYPAAGRLIAAGADPSEVTRAMSAAAYEATFNTLFVLTCEEDVQDLAASGVANSLTKTCFPPIRRAWRATTSSAKSH